MKTVCVGFIPPVMGVDGEFNTFRLGKRYFKDLSPGEIVFLLDEKKKIVFGKAEVTRLENGPLMEMCAQFAHENHSELGKDPDYSAASLYQTLSKIYGPRIVTPTKNSTVIYLKRLE